MTQPGSDLPQCPKCGNARVTLCGQSLEYGPEEWLGQALQDRERHTLAYQCDCGMAFTQTVKGNIPPAKWRDSRCR